LAAVGGAHFLPYAWLHRTRIYVAFAGAVSLGAFALQILLQATALPCILLYMSVVYWITALLVYRRAGRQVHA
jgi:hypothetical protein